MREREREMDRGNPGTADKLTKGPQKRMVDLYETRFDILFVLRRHLVVSDGGPGGVYALFPYLRRLVGKLLA